MVFFVHTDASCVHGRLRLGPVCDGEQHAAPLESEYGLQILRAPADLHRDLRVGDDEADRNLIVAHREVSPDRSQATEVDAERHVERPRATVTATIALLLVISADELDSCTATLTVRDGEAKGQGVPELSAGDVP